MHKHVASRLSLAMVYVMLTIAPAGAEGRAYLDPNSETIVGYFPISDNFSIYTQDGQLWRNANGSALGVPNSQNHNNFFDGLRHRFQDTEVSGLTAEYQRFTVQRDSIQPNNAIQHDRSTYPLAPESGDTGLDALTVGMRFSF